MTFKEFIEAHRINVVGCELIGHEDGDSKVRTYHYWLRLQQGPIGTPNTYVVESFGTGEGNVKRWARETDARVQVPVNIEGGERISRASQLPGHQDSLAWRAFTDAVAKRYQPDVESVLYCLASDASSIQNARNFEEWASDLGFDPDSRKAEKIYHACQSEAMALQRWLGLEKYAQLLECTED